MKKFKFRLQALLDIREAKEKEVQNELSRVVALQNRERAVQEEYRGRLAEQRGKYAERLRGGGFAPSDIMMYERYIEFAHRVIERQQEKIEAMEPEIKKVRERLVEAARERRVVEKLKEKKWNEYLYELNRETARENDDMNQKLYGRQLRSLTEGAVL
ncbi:MAG TPA: flagellar export protein FliJ [Spirochaetes bacterium]|nr:flagellar export protein FliJ [Spirochaetota bacterium]